MKSVGCSYGVLHSDDTVSSGRYSKYYSNSIGWLDLTFLKAINTVLAFLSARKHLATTFPAVRSSVESLLKE